LKIPRPPTRTTPLRGIRVMQLSTRIRSPLHRGRVFGVALHGRALSRLSRRPDRGFGERNRHVGLDHHRIRDGHPGDPGHAATCTAPQLLPAFASLGDTRDYVLAPGGSFKGKDLDGWQVLKANSTSRSYTPTVRTRCSTRSGASRREQGLAGQRGHAGVPRARRCAPGMRRVALRFTSVAVDGDAGEWRLDDLYVDPRGRI
jgi:hypothetical protein